MRAELTELRAWKEAALARYPDLAVDPKLRKARDLFKTAVHNCDAEIERGAWDDHPVMVAVLEGLGA